ncbi:MAG: hypothetical protein AAGI15_06240 [Pseudomonadota bacterium]
MSDTRPGVIIAGAGLSGLALALALQRAGLSDWALYDAGDPTPAPSELMPVTPNGARVLHALGLRDWLAANAEQPATMEERVGGNGFALRELPLGTFGADRFGAPFYLVDYKALLGALRDALGRDVPMRAVRWPTSTDASGTGPTALIVLATGLAPASTPVGESAKLNAWRGDVPLAAVPESLRSNSESLWVGGDRALWLRRSAVAGRAQFTAIAAPRRTGAAPLEGLFSGWHPVIGTLLQHATCCAPLPWPAAGGEPMLEPQAATVAMGDAAHPLPGALLQGPAAALEDAWVLSRFLEQHEHAAAEAAAQYVRYRSKRAALLLARDQAATARLLFATPLARARDRLTSTLTGRFLPELAMARLDWIYRYDCVRGFE